MGFGHIIRARRLWLGLCAALLLGVGAAGLARAQAPSPAFQAAIATAQQRLVQNRPIAAQWWLRRAFGHAQTEGQRAALRALFVQAADANPWTLNFGASIAPSSNVNGGALTQYFALGDIQLAFAPSSRALSGTEVTANGEISYRLAKGPRAATTLGLMVYGRSYLLSQAARAAAPQVSGSDYAMVMGEVSLRQQWLIGDGLGRAALSLHLGRVDYGRAPLYRYGKIAATQDFAVARGLLNLALSYEDQASQSASRADAQIYETRLAYATQPPGRALWSWTLQGRITRSPMASDTFHEWRAAASVAPLWRLFSAQPTLSLGLGFKRYDTFVLSFDGRSDRFASLGLGLAFEEVSFLGFSPVVNLSATRSLSNIARYDTAELRASLGLQSQF